MEEKMKERAEKSRKSQIGVEFFLVLSVVAAFVVILYGISNQQIGKTRALNDALLSKNAVDVLAQSVDFVYLSGEESVLTKELLVSPNSNCFYHNTTSNRLYCTVSSEYLQELTAGKEEVVSSELLTPASTLQISQGCKPVTNSWVKATVSFSGGQVTVTCQST